VSKGNSRREYLYSLYTKLYPKKLEDTLGTKLKTIQLERRYEKRRVDITGIDEQGSRYLIEIALKSEDKTHFNQIQELIGMSNVAENTVIVWCATSFTDRYLDDLIQMVSCNSDKNIEFIAVKLNSELVSMLEDINQYHHLEQVNRLKELNKIGEHFQVVKGVRCYNSKETLSSEVIDSERVYSRKEQILVQILKRLRVDSESQANVHQFKEISGNSFTIGTTYSDISYRVSFDRTSKVGIELVFAQVHSKQVFVRMYKRKEEIDDYFDYILTWDSKFQKIGTYLPFWSSNDTTKQINMFCRLVKKYLFGFDIFLKEVVQEYKSVV
jgi:hypothetical protein